VLLALCFPSPGIAWLAWFALVPLLFASRKAPVFHGFLYGFCCGLVYFAITFGWMFNFSGYRVLHHAILHSYLGCYIGIFALLYGLIGRKVGDATALLSAPLVWIVLEYTRSNLGFLSYPSTLLGHSQYLATTFTQVAAFAGVYGVSSLIVLVNAGLAATYILLAAQFKRRIANPHSSAYNNGMIFVVGASLLAFTLNTVYGLWITRQPIKGTPIKVSVVQGSISQDRKWNPRYARHIMKTYESLSLKAAKDNPQMIIWPESATPHSISQDGRILKLVQEIADRSGAFLLLGSSRAQKFEGRENRKVEYHNSAFLIAPQQSQEIQRYDKIRLLPFGEYLPYPDRIPWHWIKIPASQGFEHGKDFTVFKIDDIRFAVNICWETIFPEFTRVFVQKGAQFIVNLSNLAWFGKSAAPYQALSINVFRAIENGIFVVRAANTGVSCIIDPCGRIIGRVENGKGEDLFVEGVFTGNIVPLDSKTLYSRVGDWWVALSFAAVFIITLTALLRKSA